MRTIRNRTLALTLIAALAISACSMSIKSQAIEGVQAAHTAVGSGQDAEIQLYSAAAIPGYTAEQHRAFHVALVKYFDAEAKVIVLLKAWRAGDPQPANLSEAIGALNESLTVLKPVAPTALATVLKYIQTGVTTLQHVLALTKGGA